MLVTFSHPASHMHYSKQNTTDSTSVNAALASFGQQTSLSLQLLCFIPFVKQHIIPPLFLLPRDCFISATSHWEKKVDFCPDLQAWKRAKFTPMIDALACGTGGNLHTCLKKLIFVPWYTIYYLYSYSYTQVGFRLLSMFTWKSILSFSNSLT